MQAHKEQPVYPILSFLKNGTVVFEKHQIFLQKLFKALPKKQQKTTNAIHVS